MILKKMTNRNLDVVCSSPVGVPGSLELLDRFRDRLAERYTGTYLENAEARLRSVEEAPLCALPYSESDGSGGIYAMLWRLAEQAGTGLRIDLKKIPILQETVEICNTLDVDPYTITSDLLLCLSTDGAYLSESLREQGYPNAYVIGKTSEDNKRLICYDDTERFLTRP